ncbi:deaminase [Micromonospora sp. CPCC 205546]|uniref:deaminase n=1 Tax=Micromonospora sp. CPCC 205546 TaxID=3122397 RepID=UPI002FF1510E
MGGVYTEASMSLDGYIAAPGDTGFDQLFQWYGNGDVAIATAKPEMTFRISQASAGHLRHTLDDTGALVVGRRLFDLVGGWDGRHPMDKPVVVVTHHVPEGWPRPGAPFTFVTDGVPFFDHVRDAPVELSNPTVVEGDRVTHLYYRVRRA